MLRTCFLQIPSGYYIQTMNSNLHLTDLLLPIGVMNVISILPLLLFAPLIECVWTCYLAMKKTPFAPAKVISEYFYVHIATNASITLLPSPKPPHVFPALLSPPSFLSCNYSAALFLITPPCPSSSCSSGPCVCHYVSLDGRFF